MYRQIILITIATTGDGISGGDRIFIELARNWSKDISVKIITTSEGIAMMKRQKLNGKHLKIENIASNLPKNFFIKYLYKIHLGIRLGFSLNFNRLPSTILYSSSDFWMDVFPCVILKIRNPKLKWVATWYQTAPNPLKGYTEGKREREQRYGFSAFLYWFSQLPVKLLIRRYADKVIVNNEEERKQFSEMDKEGKVIVLLGAVRLDEIKKFLSTNYKLLTTKKYDAVFQGRFHPQKGVVELIDIWKKVVDKKPGAILAMIGDGPLMGKVKSQIANYKLQKNVKLFGYLYDGPEKYKIFSESKIVVHPAYYDSGGMAAAEAMAFGLPCVGFNLPAYKSYYPKGILKAENQSEFSSYILKLLNDEKSRKKLGKEAGTLIYSQYSWDKRSDEIYSQIIA